MTSRKSFLGDVWTLPKPCIKNPGIAWRMSLNRETYQAIEPILPMADAGELTRRVAQNFVLYFPEDAYKNMIEDYKRRVEENSLMASLVDFETRPQFANYGLIGKFVGIPLITDKHEIPKRRLPNIGLMPDRAYWTQLLERPY